MHTRGTRYALAVALVLGSVACADDTGEDADDAGMNRRGARAGNGGRAGGAGSGGRGGSAGYGGRGGAGAGGGATLDCSPKDATLAAWCSKNECGLSEEERLAKLCEEQRECGTGISCTQISRASNSCGGASIRAIYGVDVLATSHHYAADGALIGVLEVSNACRGPTGLRRTYGEVCELSGVQRYVCPPAAGGGEDAGR